MSCSCSSRLVVVVVSIALLAAACGQSGDGSSPSSLPLAGASTTADPLESLEVTGAAPSSFISTTTTPTTSTVPDSTTTSTTTDVPATSVLDASVCQAGANFPEFEGAVSSIRADVDLDGEDDEVFLLADPVGLAHDAWMAVSFANGGVATGRWDSFFEVDIIPSALHIVELTNGSNTTPEILFTASSGPALSQIGVVTVVDCQVVTTTLDRRAFAFNSGASIAYSSSGGCAYGTGGRIEFAITEMSGTEGEWTTSVYVLNGSTWSEIDRYTNEDFPNLESPTALTLEDCSGLNIR
jgi:hypothetical protein